MMGVAYLSIRHYTGLYTFKYSTNLISLHKNLSNGMCGLWKKEKKKERGEKWEENGVVFVVIW